jgi:hypothetical protein
MVAIVASHGKKSFQVFAHNPDNFSFGHGRRNYSLTSHYPSFSIMADIGGKLKERQLFCDDR